MRVEGNSRLPKICCHSSGRLVPLVAGVGVATSTVGSSGVFACAGDGDGVAGVVAAGVVAVGVGVDAATAGSSGFFTCADDGVCGAGAVAAVGVGVGAGTDADVVAVTGTGEGGAAGTGLDWGVLGAVATAVEIGSAKSPSNSTSSHRRGCTL